MPKAKVAEITEVTTESLVAAEDVQPPAGEQSDAAVQATPEPEEPKEVTFVLGPEDGLVEDDEVGEEDDEDDDDDEEGGFDDELTTIVGQLTQLMVTNEGEAITDVLSGIREALDKQNRVLYRGLTLLEEHLKKKPRG